MCLLCFSPRPMLSLSVWIYFFQIKPWYGLGQSHIFIKALFKAQNFQGIFPFRLWQLLCFSKSKLRGLYWHYSRWLWCIHIWGVRFHRSWDWVQCTSWSDNWTSRLSSILSHSAGIFVKMSGKSLTGKIEYNT